MFRGRDNTCAHCRLRFSTRLSAITRLHDKRRNGPCREAVLQVWFSKASGAVQRSLGAAVSAARREAFVSGRSPLSKGTFAKQAGK